MKNENFHLFRESEIKALVKGIGISVFFTRLGKIFYPTADRRVKILPGRRPAGKNFTRPQAGARNFTRPEAGGRKYLAGWELF